MAAALKGLIMPSRSKIVVNVSSGSGWVSYQSETTNLLAITPEDARHLAQCLLEAAAEAEANRAAAAKAKTDVDGYENGN